MACVIFRKKKKHWRERDERYVPSSIPSVVVALPEAPDLAPDFFAGGWGGGGGQQSSRQREKEEEEEQAGQAVSVHTKHIGHESLAF